VFFVWVSLSEHKWVILAERRGADCFPQQFAKWRAGQPPISWYAVMRMTLAGNSFDDSTTDTQQHTYELTPKSAPPPRSTPVYTGAVHANQGSRLWSCLVFWPVGASKKRRHLPLTARSKRHSARQRETFGVTRIVPYYRTVKEMGTWTIE
jgi:hypothetical protein